MGGHIVCYWRGWSGTCVLITATTLARINRGPSKAEDLVQEVPISLHTHRPTYGQSQPFTPWVYAIARILWSRSQRTIMSFGRGFFHIEDWLITEQRGYWDLATWFGQLNIPIAQ